MTAAAVKPEIEAPTTKAVVRRPSQVSILRPIAPAAEVIVAQNETRELIQKALKEGRDYGTIKGTDKPTLYKAGAERVAISFGCFARFVTLEREVDHDREIKYLKRSKVWRNQFKGDKSFSWKEEAGISLGLYRYVVECQIVDRETDAVVGSFMGSCSSLESKYIDRPRDLENTIIKMAEKRALVGAALTTFGLSDQFTQDVEDLADNRNANAASAEAEDITDQVEIVKDLAWAKAFPLPFSNHKHYKEPIDTRTIEELEKGLVWTKNKINEAGAEGRELSPTHMLIEFRDALILVIADKKAVAERDQTNLDLGAASEGKAAAQETPEPPASTNVKMPPAGKVADALPIDPTSKNAMYARVKEALKSPAIDVETRDLYAKDLVNGFKRPGQPLAWWTEKLEQIVKKATPEKKLEGPDDFPSALESPDNDGLPF